MSFPYIAALSWRATMTQYVSTKAFNIGQKGMTEDGSEWRLCTAGAALTNPHRAKINANDLADAVSSGQYIEAALSTAIVAGDTSLIIADATNAFAADFFKGGYVFQPRAAGDNMRYIWKSDAENSDKFTLHVSAPFSIANAVGNTVQVCPNPWGNVRVSGASAAGETYEPFVCAANLDITSGKHFWGQVTGPHWFGNYTGAWPGDESDDRQCCFHQDGTITPIDRVITGRTLSQQIAGWVLNSGEYGDTLIFMQIE